MAFAQCFFWYSRRPAAYSDSFDGKRAILKPRHAVSAAAAAMATQVQVRACIWGRSTRRSSPGSALLAQLAGQHRAIRLQARLFWVTIRRALPDRLRLLQVPSKISGQPSQQHGVE